MDEHYCCECGKRVEGADGAFDDFPMECIHCGNTFNPKYIKHVALWGLFPGGGQSANGDTFKSLGVFVLTIIAFLVGLPFFIIGGFILASLVVLSANFAAIEKATRYAGFATKQRVR